MLVVNMETQNIISIIGGGAVGISLLYHIVKKNTDNYGISNLEINIFEKNSNVSRGLAYRHGSDANLLNRPADSMSAIHDNTSDFIHWLTNNDEWKKFYPNIVFDKNSDLYLPRSLFGMYLECLFKDTLVMAEKNNIKVNIIREEVINLQKKQHFYYITTRSGSTYLTSSVVLALGHTHSNNFDSLKESNKYFESPYMTALSQQIPKTATIAIIGSRLSAIDAALSFAHSGHIGQMAFISRNGYMPSVRPKGVFNYKLKIITVKRLHEITGYGAKSLTLKDIETMIVEEVSLAIGRKVIMDEWLNRPTDAISYLKRELSKANCKDVIIWQSVMIALNHVIEFIWQKLSIQDKKAFVSKYRSRWMAYRVGIPFQNAEKILSLMQESTLFSISKLEHIVYDKNIHKFVVSSDSDVPITTFDYAVNATGFCSDINTTKSILLKNMKKNGLLIPNQFGGMDLDFDTSRIKDRNGAVHTNLYAVGNLTEGTYFFTSVLELNIGHVNTITDLLLTRFKSRSFKQNIFSANTFVRGNYVS